MRIFLIGMMGSGKSSVGELLSKSLDLKFVDVDQVIQKEEEIGRASCRERV